MCRTRMKAERKRVCALLRAAQPLPSASWLITFLRFQQKLHLSLYIYKADKHIATWVSPSVTSFPQSFC